MLVRCLSFEQVFVQTQRKLGLCGGGTRFAVKSAGVGSEAFTTRLGCTTALLGNVGVFYQAGGGWKAILLTKLEGEREKKGTQHRTRLTGQREMGWRKKIRENLAYLSGRLETGAGCHLIPTLRVATYCSKEVYTWTGLLPGLTLAWDFHGGVWASEKVMHELLTLPFPPGWRQDSACRQLDWTWGRKASVTLRCCK
jgi:hypothetical protein